MPKFTYVGDVEVYVPDLGRPVKPGDVVELPGDPNHGFFVPAGKAAKQPDEQKD